MTHRSLFFVLILTATVLAFAFQGTRGIWEPDEGFYICAAREMVLTGDWIVPQFNLRPFLEKPPLVYWGSAFSMKLFGFNEWAARLPHALWFLLTVAAVTWFAASVWDRPTGLLSGFVYATSVVPLVGAFVVTPDTPLTFWVTWSAICFWRACSSRSRFVRGCWELALGLSLAFAVLAKGPATFVFMAPMVLFLLVTKQTKPFVLNWAFLPSLILFIGIGSAWYIAVAQYVPGAFSYFVDNQIVGRLFTAKYRRNPEWYAPFVVYLPVLVFGTLPWSVAWYRDIGSKWKRLFENPRRFLLDGEQRTLFLGFWIGIPILIFSLASSRLPLYVLPVFAPLSICSARCWLKWRPDSFSGGIRSRGFSYVLVWTVILFIAKGCVAYWPTEKDTRAFWLGIRDLLPEGRSELVVVTARRHGLAFYSGGNVEWVTTHTDPYPSFIVPEPFLEEIHEIPTSSHHHVLLVRERDYGTILKSLRDHDVEFREADAPFGYHLFIIPPASSDRWVVRLAAMGDTRSGDSAQVQLGSALYQVDQTLPLDGILLLGDNLSYTGDPTYIEEHFEKPYRPLLENGVRFFGVLGNHDISGGFAGFQLNYPRFNMRGRRYYKVSFGDNLVDCFILDSNSLVGTVERSDRVQLSWLKRELKHSQAKWKIAAMHHPLYGRIKRRPEPDVTLRSRLEPILLEGGIRIVLAGHNHVYMRLKPQKGIYHFTAGSGGKLDRDNLILVDPDLEAGEDKVNVALLLEFTREACKFRAIDILENVIDSGTIPLEGLHGTGND